MSCRDSRLTLTCTRHPIAGRSDDCTTLQLLISLWCKVPCRDASERAGPLLRDTTFRRTARTSCSVIFPDGIGRYGSLMASISRS